jgi:uncharacterized protein (TIGR02588 family)
MNEGRTRAPGDRGGGRDGQQLAPGMRLAEWVSLGASALLIAAAAGFLVFEGLQPESPQVFAEARPLLKEVRADGGRYVLPVEVINPGKQTLRDLKVGLSYPGEDGRTGERATPIDYLSTSTWGGTPASSR